MPVIGPCQLSVCGSHQTAPVIKPRQSSFRASYQTPPASTTHQFQGPNAIPHKMARGPRPEMVLKGEEDSDDEAENRFAQQLHAIASHDRKLKGLPKVAYPKTQYRLDAEKRRRRWKNARGRFCEQAVDECFDEDVRTKTLYQVDERRIDYADVVVEVEIFTERMLSAFQKSSLDYFYLGFDTEGDFVTLQITAKFDGHTFHHLFQMNRLFINNRLPEGLISVLTHPQVVFVGKLVEPEAVAVFEKYNVDDEADSNNYIYSIKYIDILDLVRTCDLLSRDNFEDGIRFASNGEFVVTRDVPEGTKHDALINAGIRACTSYFTPYVIDKRVRHVHPHQVDWSLTTKLPGNKGKMTDSMKIYAITDSDIPLVILENAAERTGRDKQDFIRTARRKPKLELPSQFMNGNLEAFFKGLKEKGISEPIREMMNRIKDIHRRKLWEETVWQWERKKKYVSLRDPWRRENGYAEVEDDGDIDPFAPGGFFDQLVNPRLEKHLTLDRNPTLALERPPAPAPSASKPSPSTPAPTPSLTPMRVSEPTQVSAPVLDSTPTLNPAPKPSPNLAPTLAQATSEETEQLDRDIISLAPSSPLEVVAAQVSMPMVAPTVAPTTTPHSGRQSVTHTPPREEDLSTVSEAESEEAMETQRAYSPSHPTPKTPPPSTSQRRHSRSRPGHRTFESTQQQRTRSSTPAAPKQWRDNAYEISRCSKAAALKRFERIFASEEEDDETLIKHIIFIFKAQTESHRRHIIPTVFPSTPFDIRNRLVTAILQNHILHHSYLHTLSLLAHAQISGLVIIDQLLQPNSDDHFLDEFLPFITPGQGDDFVDFATILARNGPHEMKARILRCGLFPLTYLDNVDMDRIFAPQRIADLVAKVCRAKDLTIPDPIKELLINKFFDFCVTKFSQGIIYTSDFVSMVSESLVRLDLPPEVAVAFFADKIPKLAKYIATHSQLPLPEEPTNATTTPFVDSPCGSDHAIISPVMHNISEVYLNGESGLNLLRQDLSLSQCISMMHHEPPLTLPYADSLGMLSLRTLNHVFHVQPTPTPHIFRSAITLLREYNAKHVIYAWCSSGLARVLAERHSWSPDLHDIKNEMNGITGKENAAFNDIAKKLFGVSICWKGRIFAGHVRPSRVATSHRALAVSLLHKAAIKFIRRHQLRRPVAEEDREQIEIAAEAEEEELRRQSLDSMERNILKQQDALNRQIDLLRRERERRSRPRDRQSEDPPKRQRSTGHPSTSATPHRADYEAHTNQKRRRY